MRHEQGRSQLFPRGIRRKHGVVVSEGDLPSYDDAIPTYLVAIIGGPHLYLFAASLSLSGAALEGLLVSFAFLTALPDDSGTDDPAAA
jgi:hypothetical protein